MRADCSSSASSVNSAERSTFIQHLAPLVKADWVVYAKRPFAGPEAVLAYLSRYTHRVAIANSRLLSYDRHTVTFTYKDYRANRSHRHKTMRLDTDEFIRRFLIHILPSGFHRIRHTGFLANGVRRERIAKIRRLLDTDPEPAQATSEGTTDDSQTQQPCPKCGGAMVTVETFLHGQTPQSRAPPWEDTA